jgi:hypothetical protein
VENVFDGDVVLIASLRLAHRVLENVLSGFAEPIFVRSQVNHFNPLDLT